MHITKIEVSDLKSTEGTALVFAGQRNLEFGIDRVVAITEDGRGYVWHEINDCGDKVFDGQPPGEDCPEQ